MSDEKKTQNTVNKKTNYGALAGALTAIAGLLTMSSVSDVTTNNNLNNKSVISRIAGNLLGGGTKLTSAIRYI